MKKIMGMAAVLVLMLVLPACGNAEKEVKASEKVQTEEAQTEEAQTKEVQTEEVQTGETDSDRDGGANTYTKDFGSYELPEGWVESREHSNDSRFFYVLEGHERDEMPDNVAVTTGSNPYAEEEHEKFRDAIMAQITEQISGYEGIELTGNGSYTAQNYIVYTFTVKESDPAVTTTQYYIVSDHAYCLVHETNFTGNPEADDAAKHIVDSFIWNR